MQKSALQLFNEGRYDRAIKLSIDLVQSGEDGATRQAIDFIRQKRIDRALIARIYEQIGLNIDDYEGFRNYAEVSMAEDDDRHLQRMYEKITQREQLNDDDREDREWDAYIETVDSNFLADLQAKQADFDIILGVEHSDAEMTANALASLISLRIQTFAKSFAYQGPEMDGWLSPGRGVDRFVIYSTFIEKKQKILVLDRSKSQAIDVRNFRLQKSAIQSPKLDTQRVATPFREWLKRLFPDQVQKKMRSIRDSSLVRPLFYRNVDLPGRVVDPEDLLPWIIHTVFSIRGDLGLLSEKYARLAADIDASATRGADLTFTVSTAS